MRDTWPDWNMIRFENARPCTDMLTTDCCGDRICQPPREDATNCLADCPGVTTDPSCGQEPRSDRDGRGITFGVGYRAASAQDCCDKCKEHATKHPGPTDPKGRGPCNSWTFCDLPVCWGLDTGWNHTYGECWLRHLADPEHPSFVQRGELSPEYRLKMMGTRKGCRLDEPWACPPTHVPWTSGSPGFKSYDPLVRWSTSGGWGNMRVSRISPTGDATLVMVNGKPALPQAT